MTTQPSKDQWDDAKAWRKHAGELRQEIGLARRTLESELSEVRAQLELAEVRMNAGRKSSHWKNNLINKAYRALIAGDVPTAVDLLANHQRAIEVARAERLLERASEQNV